MRGRVLTILAGMVLGLVAQTAAAAMYKWVDERGFVHYSDRQPMQSKASGEFNRASGTTKYATRPTIMTVEEAERQKAEARRRLVQERQDNALLATYTTENEIDAAREREINRQQELQKVAIEGIGKSDRPEDKRKLDRLLVQGQQARDQINAKYSAQKARYRELKGGPNVIQASNAPEPTRNP